MQVCNQNFWKGKCIFQLFNLSSNLPKLLRKTYFIIFFFLEPTILQERTPLCSLSSTNKRIAGKFLTVAFVPDANTYIFVSSEIRFIVLVVKGWKMIVENGDEIDMNSLPECRDTMSSRSTSILFSQADALKLAIFV